MPGSRLPDPPPSAPPPPALAALGEGPSDASWGGKAGQGTLLCGAGWDRGWHWSK